MLRINDQAPDFVLESEGQRSVTLSQFYGNRVVLYFYPKDHTSGCTQQACDFRDAFGEFLAHNAIVLGISRDSVASHQGFKQKNELPFILLSDPEGEICQRYGVWAEKKMYGKTYFGIERTTFVLDEQGKILHVWSKVNVSGHVREVLSYLDELDRRPQVQEAGL